MKLYFVRHGRTVWNLEGRFQGAGGDSPLLPESIDTLEELGQYLKDIPFDKIYSSDLPRAVKSAEIIQSQLKNPWLRLFHFQVAAYAFICFSLLKIIRRAWQSPELSDFET